MSKQLAGGVMIHSLNVVAAVFFGVKPEEGQKSNPCVWYVLIIFALRACVCVIGRGFFLGPNDDA